MYSKSSLTHWTHTKLIEPFAHSGVVVWPSSTPHCATTLDLAIVVPSSMPWELQVCHHQSDLMLSPCRDEKYNQESCQTPVSGGMQHVEPHTQAWHWESKPEVSWLVHEAPLTVWSLHTGPSPGISHSLNYWSQAWVSIEHSRRVDPSEESQIQYV